MTLFGRYRPIAHLGRGGMADVSLTIVGGPSGSGFTKLAVVKRLRANAADDPDVVSMFVDEARILSHLRHPNIVQIIEVGSQDGQAFLAMEYLDGLSLRRLRERARKAGTPLPSEVEIVALIDVLAALEHAHDLESWDGKRLEIVHRDVTPHNVIVTIDGQVKVLDFGIAKTSLRETVTEQGVIKGKLRYMSPEQALGRKVGHQSDLFSVGVMLWEAATKLRFWSGVEDIELIRMLVSGKMPISPRETVPSVAPELDAICRRALAPRTEDRYPTAAAMRDDLERYLGDGVVAARRQLAPFVQRLAHDDRARLRDVIELAARAQATDDAPASVREAIPTMAISVPAASVESAPPVRARPRPASRRLLAAFLVLGIAGLGLLLAPARRPLPALVPASATTLHVGLALDSENVVYTGNASSPPPDEIDPPAPSASAPNASWIRRPRPPVSRPGRSSSTVRPGNLALDTTDPWRSGAK